MTDRRLRVAVLSGGRSPEHDVSLKTGEAVVHALDRAKYDVEAVVIGRDGAWSLPAADVVFIALHGAGGEDGTIQGHLETIGIPYTGSGVLASALAMDKVRAGQLFAACGLVVPRTEIVHRTEWDRDAGAVLQRIARTIGIPCVMKPSDGGSSVGVTIVCEDAALEPALREAFRYGATVLAQEYVVGTEITCAVLDDGEAIALPPTQIIPTSATFFDYHAKYTPGASEEVTPPRLPRETIAAIQDTAVRAHRILGCAGMSRTDMILDAKERCVVLETNTIPGMTATSLLPQAAAAAGIPFPQLLDHIIHGALLRAGSSIVASMVR